VVTVLSPVLREEEQIASVRHELIVLMDQPVPKRVVVRLGRVTELSSLAIAMFLGHLQRLERLGGCLRLSDVRDDLVGPLETSLLTTPLRIYTTVEEAIRDPWPIA
jgi:anti-anti-sigma regulatory factor